MVAGACTDVEHHRRTVTRDVERGTHQRRSQRRKDLIVQDRSARSHHGGVVAGDAASTRWHERHMPVTRYIEGMTSPATQRAASRRKRA